MGAELFVLDTPCRPLDSEVDATYTALCHEDILPGPATGRLLQFLNEVEACYPGNDEPSVWASFPHLVSASCALLDFSFIKSAGSLSDVRRLALAMGLVAYEPGGESIDHPG